MNNLITKKQYQLLKQKTPAERFQLMLDLIESQLQAMRAGIKFQNPGLNNNEVEICLKEKILKIYSLKH